MLNPKTILDQKDLTPAWESICEQLGAKGRDFHTVSMHPRKGEEHWFHASIERGIVVIGPAKDPMKHTEVTKSADIGQAQFELIAARFNKYVKGERDHGIRATDSHMSSYIITLIAELL